MDREVVKELIQGEFNTGALKQELNKILDKTHRKVLFEDYFELEQALGEVGASQNTAKLIYKELS